MPREVCARCGGIGWICEAHPGQLWPHGTCAGVICDNPECSARGTVGFDDQPAYRVSDDDWDRTVAAAVAATPPTPVEHVLWTLRKGKRIAEARVRPHPHGQELRFLVDGELLWSEVFKHGRGVVLGEVVEAKRREFEERGWVTTGSAT